MPKKRKKIIIPSGFPTIKEIIKVYGLRKKEIKQVDRILKKIPIKNKNPRR